MEENKQKAAKEEPKQEVTKQPIDKGSFSNISYAIFNNRNKKNRLYRVLQFTKSYPTAQGWRQSKWTVNAGELSSLKRCIEQAGKWLRDK